MKNSLDRLNSVLKNQIVASKIKTILHKTFLRPKTTLSALLLNKQVNRTVYNSPTANWISTLTMVNKI